uniref:Uncharacterized protein MANES_S088800 n=1 Tax=Rhizophora mucronata TaxID=61149 RepID=A0A2P2K3S2_RHIMU
MFQTAPYNKIPLSDNKPNISYLPIHARKSRSQQVNQIIVPASKKRYQNHPIFSTQTTENHA